MEHSYIACVYRSPLGKVEYFFLKLSLFLSNVHIEFENIVIVGDFNTNALASDRN